MSDQKFLGFHHFKMEETGEEYGSFEIFRHLRLFGDKDARVLEDGSLMEDGWYWQAGFPGCIPDADPIGPFAPAKEAYANAQEINVEVLA